MSAEFVGFLDWLYIFHYQDTTWFNSWEPEKETYGHVLSQMGSILHYYFEGWGIWSFHFGGPCMV